MSELAGWELKSQMKVESPSNILICTLPSSLCLLPLVWSLAATHGVDKNPRENGETLVRELAGDGPTDSQPYTCLKEPAVTRFQKLSQPIL